MKLFESEHYFNYPWDQVTAANWQKYPNELSTHVVSVDILNRSIDVDNKTLRTERLIGCKQAIPNWLSFIVGGQKLSYVREVSEVDLINNTLVLKSHNLTMNHILLVNETVIYKPDPQLKSRTIFTQSAEITAYAAITRICDKLEEWSVERFGQNAKTGKLAFEGVLDTLSTKWEESGVFVSDVLKDFNNDLTEKTSDVLSEVSKLGLFKLNSSSSNSSSSTLPSSVSSSPSSSH
ncbi:PRELI-like family-domain-containing protein [Scheffersomyces coipomensis]|uniref:PRELI-like family-domain-containing protein n=1 Tax=Scheffersomyces coipomensis TaxID=1788519 RepID=UPI00315D83DD